MFVFVYVRLSCYVFKDIQNMSDKKDAATNNQDVFGGNFSSGPRLTFREETTKGVSNPSVALLYISPSGFFASVVNIRVWVDKAGQPHSLGFLNVISTPIMSVVSSFPVLDVVLVIFLQMLSYSGCVVTAEWTLPPPIFKLCWKV